MIVNFIHNQSQNCNKYHEYKIEDYFVKYLSKALDRTLTPTLCYRVDCITNMSCNSAPAAVVLLCILYTLLFFYWESFNCLLYKFVDIGQITTLTFVYYYWDSYEHTHMHYTAVCLHLTFAVRLQKKSSSQNNKKWSYIGFATNKQYNSVLGCQLYVLIMTMICSTKIRFISDTKILLANANLSRVLKSALLYKYILGICNCWLYTTLKKPFAYTFSVANKTNLNS